MKQDKSQMTEPLHKEITQLKTTIKKLKNQLTLRNTAFINIIEKSLDTIIILDKEEVSLYVNEAALALFGCKVTELLGKQLALEGYTETSSEIKISRPDGSVAIAEVNVIEIEWYGQPATLARFRDITTHRESEEMLTYLSHHDYLTDLPNRVYFEKRMFRAIEEANDRKNHMALLYLDLDNFKSINDTLGHDVGDLLLKEISALLQDSIRQGDLVARLGGDEFALILASLRKPEYAAGIAQNILNKLSKAFTLREHEVFTNASIGIAIYPLAGNTAVKLIKSADTAMYAAKKNGKNQYRYFTEHLNKQNKENFEILNGLRSLMLNQELFLEYQPIIDLKTSQYFGAEALLRWQHPTLGLVPPNQFLARAEEIGLMLQVGQWVIENALTEYNSLKTASSFLSINVSANELDGAKVADMILKIISNLNLEPNNLILELTETSVMRNPDAAIKKLKKLSELDIKIAIDDYGTGYSSLSYLKKFPIAILKIDKSFVDDIGKDPNDTVIVKSTIQLAHSLGLKVIAEGVETKAQLDFLRKYDCDYVQGYYVSKPLPLNALKAYVADFNKVST